MTEIQQNRWDQLIRRASNIVGGGSQVGDTLNELFPMLDVETLVSELAILSGTRLALGSTSQGASALDLSHSQLFNPADSNMILTVERVELNMPVGTLVEYAFAVLPLAGSSFSSVFRDTRLGFTDVPVGQIHDVQQPAGLPTIGMIFVTTDTQASLFDKQGLFVLGPGTGITFATTLINRTFRVTYHWRERVAEPAELNF